MSTINMRVRLKSDTTAKWQEAGNKKFVPQKGEFIYYNDIYRAKIGDGVTNVNELPFLADSNTTYSAGTGLTLNGTTFNHFNSITAQPTIGLYKIKYDAQGHINGASNIAKADITGLGIPGSDNNQTIKAGSAAFDANAAVNIAGGSHISVTGDKSTNQITINNTWPTLSDLGVQNGFYFNPTANINWNDAGHFQQDFTDYPYDYGGLHWTGQSDGIDLFARETGSDNLDLILRFSDDSSNKLQVQNQTGSCVVEIGADGHISAGEIYRIGQPVASTGTRTSVASTGITVSASSSEITFTGKSHNHSASDSGHTHTYSKTTSASFTGTSHNHSASDSGHTHTVDFGTKGVSVSKAADGVTDYYYIKTTGSASFNGNSHSHNITDKSHSHSYTKVTGGSFTGTKDLKTGSSGTGITASASAPTFTGTAHGHGIGDNGHAHSAHINNGTVQVTAPATGSTSYYYITSSGATSTFTGNSHSHGVTDNGHTHTYDKATSITSTGGNHSHTYQRTTVSYDKDSKTLIIKTTESATTGTSGNLSVAASSIGYTATATTSSKTGLSINGTTAGGSVSTTVYDPQMGVRNGDKWTTIGVGWLLSLVDGGVTVDAAKTGISINNTTAGGSVSAPKITITDPGHTHTYTPAGSVSISTETASTGSSATGITVTNGATQGGTVTLNNLNSNWGHRQGDTYTEFGAASLSCGIGSVTSGSGKANISVSGAAAGGSVSLGYTDTATSSGKANVSIGGTTASGTVSTPTITTTVNDPGHRHASRDDS